MQNPKPSSFTKAKSEVLQVYVRRPGKDFRELHLWWRLPPLYPGDNLQGRFFLDVSVWPPTQWNVATGGWQYPNSPSELWIGFSLEDSVQVALPQACETRDATSVEKNQWAARAQKKLETMLELQAGRDDNQPDTEVFFL